MQPIPLHEEVYLYKPDRPPETSRSVQVGGAQGVNVPKAQSQMQAAAIGDLFYMRVVREWKEDGGSFGQEGNKGAENEQVVTMDVDSGDGNSMDVDVKPQTVGK